MSEYNNVSNRLLVDIDNERPRDFDIVGLTKRGVDYAVNFKNERVLLHEGDYVYMYTDNSYPNGEISYIFCEGYVISNPYDDIPYKWCCRIVGDVEYVEDYNKRFGKGEKIGL